MKCPKCGTQVMSYHNYCWYCGASLKRRSKKHRLANFLEKQIIKKPYDDYICIDKNVLWKVIEELRR